MYRIYPVLYELTLIDYRNEKMKLNVWEKIAEELQHMLRVLVFKIYRLFDSSNHNTQKNIIHQKTWSGNQTKVIDVCFCSVCALFV